jgi:hypothetical protein
MSETITTTATGAKSSVEPDYTFLPTAGLLKAIERFESGMPKYGRDNWRKGLNDPTYLQGRLAHAIGHLFLLRDALEKLERKESLSPKELDDHIGAVLWFGMFAACHHSIQVLDTERAVQAESRRPRSPRTATGPLRMNLAGIGPHAFEPNESNQLLCAHCGECWENHVTR